MLKRRGLFSCQVYSVELIDSQFLILQVRQLETENIKMKRKKILLEEYNNSDITKGSFKNKKEDMVFGIWQKIPKVQVRSIQCCPDPAKKRVIGLSWFS